MTPQTQTSSPDVCLRELGLRDGLQMTTSHPSTDEKIAWIQMAHEAGVRHLEVGSFLPPDRFPQFADIRELIAHIATLPGCHASALVLNERGIDDALTTPLDEIILTVSATEAHSLANIRRSRDQALALVRHADVARHALPRPPHLVAAIPVAFGCSIAGPVSPDVVVDLAMACLDAGADAIGIADTVGFAGPHQVRMLCRLLIDRIAPATLTVHLHDTRGMAIANAYAALEEGVRILDGTLGGLGGCPFAPGATGNVAFEDLVYLCERSGHTTGIDITALVGILSIIRSSMPDEPLSGTLGQAGPPATIPWAG